MNMTKSLKYNFYVLRCQRLLLALLVFAAVVIGIAAGYDFCRYSSRVGETNPLSALAYVLEGRSLVGLLGAVWCCVFIGVDFRSRGINSVVYRGVSRTSCFTAKYFLLLCCCAAVSLIMQLVSLLFIAKYISTIPAVWILRCIGLRLVLDLGVMITPLIFAVALNGNIASFALCLAYGLLIFFKQEPVYMIWVNKLNFATDIAKLWSIAAGLISSIAAFCVRRELI